MDWREILNTSSPVEKAEFAEIATTAGEQIPEIPQIPGTKALQSPAKQADHPGFLQLSSARARENLNHQQDPLSFSSEPDRFKPTSQQLADVLGAEWNTISADPYLKAGWTRTITENRIVEAGEIPPWFKVWAYCENCGDVLIAFSTEGALVGCPWCHCPNKPNFVL